jgi:ESCRT-I complex subunit VPS28
LSLLKLEQEIRLFSTNQDRETFETMADLYSIFIATENLEKAYIRDTVNHDE